MTHEIETLTFTTTEQYAVWVQRVVKYKYQRYDRVPNGCTLTFGDGDTRTNEYGKKGGTMLSNLGFELALLTGRMKTTDAPLLDITEKQGMMLEINWGE